MVLLRIDRAFQRRTSRLELGTCEGMVFAEHLEPCLSFRAPARMPLWVFGLELIPRYKMLHQTCLGREGFEQVLPIAES